MQAAQTLTTRPPGAARRGHHPGIVLTIIALSQLMIVLDATIVTIALPEIRVGLRFSETSLSWVQNAYTLTFGGLLLLGGRAGDILGRRRVFVVGITVFTLASLIGGFATTSAWLLACRAVQGLGGAIASPTALALITTNFEEGKERNRAFGVFAAVSSSGAAIGLLAGGMLTSWLSWQWVFFVNAPIGALVLLLTPMFIGESEPHPGRFDIAGAITSTVGMAALVYGFIRASDQGWSNGLTIASFVAAVVLLVGFVLIETRSAQPIVPLRMFANRDRSGAYLVMLLFAAALLGMFYFLSQFIEGVMNYSPLRAGLAFLPISGAVVIAAQIASMFVARLGPRPFMVAGAAIGAGGLIWLSQVTTTTGYAEGILGPTIIFGFGMGFVFVPLTLIAVSGVDSKEAGAASSLLNVMQQVGGTLGLSILVTTFSTAAKNKVADMLHHGQIAALRSVNPKLNIPNEVFTRGVNVAFMVSFFLAVAAAVISLLVVKARARDVKDAPMTPGMGA